MPADVMVAMVYNGIAASSLRRTAPTGCVDGRRGAAGGDLGWKLKGDVAPQFANAAFQLAVRQFATGDGLVLCSFGASLVLRHCGNTNGISWGFS